MIVARLSGGMGNQMFQYAFGRCLAYQKQTQLKLDISFFDNYDWHEFSLEPLSLGARELVSSSDLKRFPWPAGSVPGRLKSLLKSVIFNAEIIQEKHFQFDESVFSLKSKHLLLSGYWQSEKYFKQIENEIRKEFTVRAAPSAQNALLLHSIRQQNSVSLHIRRGNYATVKEVNDVISPCSPLYYKEAVNLIKSKVPDPVFYVFSDEIEWAKQNLKLDAKMHFVEGNTSQTDYEDLRLMYSCKHNITANSTFSWWASWLNSNEGKIVVTPKKWFNDESVNIGDLHPLTWIKL